MHETTVLKWLIQGHLVHSSKHTMNSSVQFKHLLISPEHSPPHTSPSFRPFSVCDLPVLDISCQWNHSLCGLGVWLLLESCFCSWSTWNDIPELLSFSIFILTALLRKRHALWFCGGGVTTDPCVHQLSPYGFNVDSEEYRSYFGVFVVIVVHLFTHLLQARELEGSFF